MKKLSLRLLVLASLGSSCAVQASEFITPLPGLYGFLRFPIEYFAHHGKDEEHKECPKLAWIINGIGYHRHAAVSYPNCGPRGCTVPYSALIFNRSPFLLSGIFYDSVVPAANANPFLSVSELSPLFELNENGVIFNVTGEGYTEYCGVPYRYGVVFRLPVRDIEVLDIGGVDDMEGLSVGEVFQQRNEEFNDDPANRNYVFAARLDFISALNQIALPPISMVHYGNGTCTDRTTIASEFGSSANQDVGYPCVTDGVNVDPVNGYPPVALIYRADGTMPSELRWGDLTSNAQPILAADGSGIPQDGRGRFSDNVNYAAALAGDVKAQSKLFVVPTLNNAGNFPMSAGAQAIQEAIVEALPSVGGGAIDFLEENGVDFRDGRTQGVGDLDMEFFVGRNWEYCENNFFTDLKLVIRFPTADRICNCKQVLRLPAGNNKHYEIMGGFVGGWDINDRFKWMTDLTVAKVLKANVFAPATFKGSTVKYIGPCITVQTNWWYLVYHTDLSVFAREGVGFDIGYELFYKNVDKICAFQKTAVDFFGNEQPIDPSKLAVNTQRLANKARVAFFSKWDNFEVLGGWSWVFSGYNAPRDIDWYLSLSAYF